MVLKAFVRLFKAFESFLSGSPPRKPSQQPYYKRLFMRGGNPGEEKALSLKPLHKGNGRAGRCPILLQKGKDRNPKAVEKVEILRVPLNSLQQVVEILGNSSIALPCVPVYLKLTHSLRS